jgi:ribosome recycling factor
MPARLAGRTPAPEHRPMTTDPDTILLETEEAMEKALDHLKHELRGVRTGRASTAVVEYVKVDYYGSSTDLKSLASITIPEPTQILIKPFDAGSINEIKKAIESAGLGLNPMSEGKQLRINIPPPSRERRMQLAAHCKKVGEETKVTIRNARRDGNKHADGLSKQAGKTFPEDEVNTLKEEIQALLKKYEADVDHRVEEKTKEVMEI